MTHTDAASTPTPQPVQQDRQTSEPPPLDLEDVSRPAENAGADAAWSNFQGHLALALSDLDEDEFLELSHKGTDQSILIVAQGGYGMRAEAFANAYLPADHLSSQQSVAGMVGMGWHAPTRSLAGYVDADGSRNYFVDLAAPVPYAWLAELIVKTFRGAYYVRHPSRLEYRAASHADNTLTIRFPTLRIKRKVTAAVRPMQGWS